MSTYQKLVECFQSELEVPVEIPDIRTAVKSLGFDGVIEIKPVDCDPEQLWGEFLRFEYSPGVYKDDEEKVVIGYCAKLELANQRLVCCKELIHVLNGKSSRTTTQEDLEALADSMAGLLNNDEMSVADLAATTDKLAVYQAIAILFPMAARNAAKKAIEEGRKTIDQVAKDACIPLHVAEMALHERWPKVLEGLKSC